LWLAHTTDTDKTRLSCLVHVGGVSRIDDKSRLSATENFETVLSSLEMWCKQTIVLFWPSFQFSTRLVCKPVHTADRTEQKCSVSDILRTTATEISLDLLPILFTPPTRQSCFVLLVVWTRNCMTWWQWIAVVSCDAMDLFVCVYSVLVPVWHWCLHAILQHGFTVQYGLDNTSTTEHKSRLCQQLVDLADIMLDGYTTQLESIKWHLKHQSKDYVTAAHYEETLRKYEQDRALLLTPLSMSCSVLQAPDFWQILRQCQECTQILTQIYDNVNFPKKKFDNLIHSLKIVNITEYITVNIETSLFTSFRLSHKIIDKYVMICN